jgi:hypothetical protein
VVILVPGRVKPGCFAATRELIAIGKPSPCENSERTVVNLGAKICTSKNSTCDRVRYSRSLAMSSENSLSAIYQRLLREFGKTG